jgi:hypothetical protein
MGIASLNVSLGFGIVMLLIFLSVIQIKAFEKYW